MQHGHLQLATHHILVEAHAGPRHPTQPKRGDEDETHPVAGVGQILGERRGILLIVDGCTAVQLALHREDVKVVVDNGDDAGPQDEDCESGGVRVRCAPVQHADVGLLVEVGVFLVAQQRRAAQHGRRHPREHHPALTASARLYLSDNYPTRAVIFVTNEVDLAYTYIGS